jgi:hypothetical protein
MYGLAAVVGVVGIVVVVVVVRAFKSVVRSSFILVAFLFSLSKGPTAAAADDELLLL